MSKATKAVVAIVVVILAVVLISPKFVGSIAEKRVKELAASMSKNKLPVRVMKFDKGWFSSNVEIQLNPGQKPIQLKLYQGPVIFHSGLSFAVAKATTTHKFPPFDATFTAKLHLFGGASLHILGTTAKNPLFMPQSVNANINVKDIQDLNKVHASVQLNDMSKGGIVNLQNFTLTLDAMRKQLAWTVLASANANDLKAVIPGISTTKFDKIAVQGLTLKPQALIKAYLTLKYTRNPMTAAKIVLSQVQQIITNKTSADIVALTVDTPQGNGSYNFSVSWPNLPQTTEAVDYLQYLKLSNNISIPKIKLMSRRVNFALKELLLKMEANENFISNTQFSIKSIDYKKYSRTALLRDLDIKMHTDPIVNKQQSLYNKFTLKQACAMKYCINNSEMNLNLNNLSQNRDISQAALENGFNYFMRLMQTHRAQNPQDQIQQIENLYKLRINKNSSIVWNLRSELPEGVLSGKANISWPDANTKKPNWLLSPAMEIDLSVPIKLTEKKQFANEEDQIAGFLKKKCISSKNGYYTTTITYKNHDLFLNGVSSDVCINHPGNSHHEGSHQHDMSSSPHSEPSAPETAPIDRGN